MVLAEILLSVLFARASPPLPVSDKHHTQAEHPDLFPKGMNAAHNGAVPFILEIKGEPVAGLMWVDYPWLLSTRALKLLKNVQRRLLPYSATKSRLWSRLWPARLLSYVLPGSPKVSPIIDIGNIAPGGPPQQGVSVLICLHFFPQNLRRN
jgi:hypothetical protein